MDSYKSAKEEIKRAADIAELIGQYVQIKKAGLNYVGLCPFHSEKDPSFSVSPSKQMFHCFGCKKGGDIFDFWMEYHKVSFSQAMTDLGERYHVTLPRREITPSQKRKMELRELLVAINGSAARYYHNVLTKSEMGTPGREYCKKRSINREISEEYSLGYASDKWDALARYLAKEKVDMEKAVQAGLIIPRKTGGYYDRFRGRVIFPICNMRKQVVGFGARVLDDSLPKYLNTPETPVFRKGELLYGLHAAYQSIREKGMAVIVEGYTDVLALRRHGFHEAVATLGTALTRDHIRGLKGYTREVIVVFDSDAAGKGAVIKSLPLFLNEGFSARVMVLPEGDDPDSFVNREGIDGFSELLNDSMPMFDFYLDLKLSLLDKGIDGQLSLLQEMLPVLSGLDNEAQRSLHVRRFSEKSGIAESVILNELGRGKGYRERKPESVLRKELKGSKANRGDDLPLLNLLIHSPHIMERVMNLDWRLLLTDPVIMEILDSMRDLYARETEFSVNGVMERLEGESAREVFRESLLAPPIYPDELVEQAVNEFENRIRKVKLSESIQKAREQGDILGLNRLLKLFKDEQD